MNCISLFILTALVASGACDVIEDILDDVLGIFGLPSDPDSKRNVSELISSKGYPVENYHVQTKDGYILGLQRIPSGHPNRVIPTIGQRKPVLLQHGLLSSATDWVMNFPDQSLGFILADAGYDVWLGNIRGNTYSRRHVKYSPKSKEFWKFSFDEMAEYDIPSIIDFILEKTGEKELFYIGHSQGTTIGFALFSQKPEYSEKVKLFIGLAPVSNVGHMKGALRYLAPFAPDLEFIFGILGDGEFLPNNAVMKYLSEFVCETKLKFICADTIFLMCGTDYSQMNETRLGVYIAHTPAGASTQSLVHFAQMINSKNFQKYDYGKKENLMRYNQTTPPEYHVEDINVKVAVLWSDNDKLADPEDVAFLISKLKTLVSSTRVTLSSFNHLDFVWGVNANTLVYEKVKILLEQYSKT